jgi:thioredoxin-related protein
VNDIVLAKINGDKYGDLATKHGVDGFPTILLFKKRVKKGKEYEGLLNPKDLLDFLHKQLD